MNKIPSCIKGLDELIDGGIPEKSVSLVSGTCGTGKTIFGLQFVMMSKDPGVFVSFEDDIDEIRESSKSFGWDMGPMEASNRLRVLKYDPFRFEDILEVIENNIREINAKRVVLDSISALGSYMKDASELRRTMLQINKVMKKNGCTTLVMSEILSGTNSFSRFGVEEFVTDGVIVLGNALADGEFRRTLSIQKMRNVNHSRKMHVYTISDKGITVTPRVMAR